MSKDGPSEAYVRQALTDPFSSSLMMESEFQDALRTAQSSDRPLIAPYVLRALRNGVGVDLAGARTTPGHTAFLYSVKDVVVGPGFVSEFACVIVFNSADELAFLDTNMLSPEMRNRQYFEDFPWSIRCAVRARLEIAGLPISGEWAGYGRSKNIEFFVRTSDWEQILFKDAALRSFDRLMRSFHQITFEERSPVRFALVRHDGGPVHMSIDGTQGDSVIHAVAM